MYDKVTESTWKKKNSIKRENENLKPSSPVTCPPSSTFQLCSNCCREGSFDGEREIGKHSFSVGKIPFEAPLILWITHFLDWSFPTSQRRAAEVRQPAFLCTLKWPTWITVGSRREVLNRPSVFEVLEWRTLLWVPVFKFCVISQIGKGLGKGSQDLVFL